MLIYLARSTLQSTHETITATVRDTSHSVTVHPKLPAYGVSPAAMGRPYTYHSGCVCVPLCGDQRVVYFIPGTNQRQNTHILLEMLTARKNLRWYKRGEGGCWEGSLALLAAFKAHCTAVALHPTCQIDYPPPTYRTNPNQSPAIISAKYFFVTMIFLSKESHDTP